MADPAQKIYGRPIIFLGPPGAGKGTQAKQIAKLFGVPHISTGDIIRDHIARDTELGRRAKPYTDSGDLVPDSVVLDLVSDRLTGNGCARGFVLDGFPRTLPQAERFEGILRECGCPEPLVVNFVVDTGQLLRRLTGRRMCSVGGEIYNIYDHPPKVPDQCDNDGGKLVQRPDDREEVIRERLYTYEEMTSPLVNYYRPLGLLVDVDGAAPSLVVTQYLTKILTPVFDQDPGARSAANALR